MDIEKKENTILGVPLTVIITLFILISGPILGLQFYTLTRVNNINNKIIKIQEIIIPKTDNKTLIAENPKSATKAAESPTPIPTQKNLKKITVSPTIKGGE